MVRPLPPLLAMTTVDFLIVYLAFGSPLAVYRYLEIRSAGRSQSIGHAVFALFFWIPSVIRIGYRYLTNADFVDAFVSRNNLDSRGRHLTEMCDGLTAELMSSGQDVPLYDAREVLERYVGLSIANDTGSADGRSSDLYEAVGHADGAIAAVCLMRRNRRRLQHHHSRARRDFLNLFENASIGGTLATQSLLRLAIDLASRLGDREAVGTLRTLAYPRGEVWNSETHNLALDKPSTAAVAPLAMQTMPFSND